MSIVERARVFSSPSEERRFLAGAFERSQDAYYASRGDARLKLYAELEEIVRRLDELDALYPPAEEC